MTTELSIVEKLEVVLIPAIAAAKRYCELTGKPLGSLAG